MKEIHFLDDVNSILLQVEETWVIVKSEEVRSRHNEDPKLLACMFCLVCKCWASTAKTVIM
jgi:hypothetical protein